MTSQAANITPDSSGNGTQFLEGRIALASFHPADVAGGRIRPQRKFFLGQSLCLARFANSVTEHLQRSWFFQPLQARLNGDFPSSHYSGDFMLADLCGMCNVKTNLLSIQMTLVLVACYCVRGQGFVYDQQVGSTNSPSDLDQRTVPTEQPIGQSFVPNLSAVAFIQLYVGGDDATCYVNLWAGSLANGILLGSTIPVFVPGGFFNYTNFLFSSSIAVTPGTTYYLQPVVQPRSVIDVGITSDLPGLGYANGTAFFKGVAQPGYDLLFKEGIVVPEPATTSLILLGVVILNLNRRENK